MKVTYTSLKNIILSILVMLIISSLIFFGLIIGITQNYSGIDITLVTFSCIFQFIALIFVIAYYVLILRMKSLREINMINEAYVQVIMTNKDDIDNARKDSMYVIIMNICIFVLLLISILLIQSLQSSFFTIINPSSGEGKLLRSLFFVVIAIDIISLILLAIFEFLVSFYIGNMVKVSYLSS